MNLFDYDDYYVFPTELLSYSDVEREEFIRKRLKKSGLVHKTKLNTLRNIFEYLYDISCSTKIYRPTLPNYLNYLEPFERVIALKLADRHAGSKNRLQYGEEAVIAFRNAKYQCEVEDCKAKDVRCLDIDHKYGRRSNEQLKEEPYSVDDFQILCANHHRIKSAIDTQRRELILKCCDQVLFDDNKHERKHGVTLEGGRTVKVGLYYPDRNIAIDYFENPLSKWLLNDFKERKVVLQENSVNLIMLDLDSLGIKPSNIDNPNTQKNSISIVKTYLEQELAK